MIDDRKKASIPHRAGRASGADVIARRRRQASRNELKKSR